MRFAERMMLSRRAVAARRGDAKSFHSVKSPLGHSRFGVESVLDLQRSHGNAFVQRLVQRNLAISTATGFIARQPNPPPDPGWSDAPDKGFNKWVNTVDETGKLVRGKGQRQEVWRVPVA